MNYGFLKVAAATPKLQLANCTYNASAIVKAAWRASAESVKLLITPELGITGYTCGDLFLQQHLLEEAIKALDSICKETADLDLVLVVGLPIQHKGKLYNCAAVIKDGELLGLVPKTNLPNYGEFYEVRQFAPAFDDNDTFYNDFFYKIPIGKNLLFQCDTMPEFVLSIEICEDLWAPVPPSCYHAQAGATIIANLSASNELVGKANYRRQLVANQSARLLAGYVYANAGLGESGSDMVFAGGGLIAENGIILKEGAPYTKELQISEIDLQKLLHERRRMNTFPTAEDGGYILVSFSLEKIPSSLTRYISPSPFIPATETDLAENCESILSIQAHGLAKRLEHANAKTAILGISGGLDSSLALLVTARAFDLLGRAPSDIMAISMPGFGTTNRTQNNADQLSEKLSVTLKKIDITDTVLSHFNDIRQNQNSHDIVFENAQARIRTLVLMDLANKYNGLVVGTGDLSELALGWATYNGDHMSMYGVNASVPKTLIRYLVVHEAKTNPHLKQILLDILDTPVSPELLPAVNGEISQQTEEIVGPYALHDFFLYYIVRWGFSPSKIYYLAQYAFQDLYTEAIILKWLKIFYSRFFSQQFKRNCLPDGPKVGTISFSPRGDWRMPSDAVATTWLREIEEL